MSVENFAAELVIVLCSSLSCPDSPEHSKSSNRCKCNHNKGEARGECNKD